MQSNVESCNGNINWLLLKIFEENFVNDSIAENGVLIQIKFNHVKKNIKNLFPNMELNI